MKNGGNESLLPMEVPTSTTGKTGDSDKGKTGDSNKEKGRVDLKIDDGNLTLLPMEIPICTMTGDSNKQNKPVAVDSGGTVGKRVQNKWDSLDSGSKEGKRRVDMDAANNTKNKPADVRDPQESPVWIGLVGSDITHMIMSASCNIEDLIDGIMMIGVPNRKKLEHRFLLNSPYKELTQQFHTWEEKVVAVLNVVRRREITYRNPKTDWPVPTRFCEFNVAFFDFDKESNVVHGPLFCDIPPSRYNQLDESVNVISIKVAQSDVPYPINIYGTILARDENDLRCVYLFKRGRDNPQLITRKNRRLALTGPYRAFGCRDYMYFEFHLKIKGDGEVDEDFSKGLIMRRAYSDTFGVPNTFSLESYLSTMDMVCVPVNDALEASVGVKFLNGKSTFTGKIFASTSGCDTCKMVLYDSQVAGTSTEFGSGGSVSLSRHIVAVPIDECLLLYFSAFDSYNKYRRLKFVIGHDVDARTFDLGTYKLQLKIVWKGVFRQQRTMLRNFGGSKVLW